MPGSSGDDVPSMGAVDRRYVIQNMSLEYLLEESFAEETAIPMTDPRYYQIPIVLSTKGEILVRIGNVLPGPAVPAGGLGSGAGGGPGGNSEGGSGDSSVGPSRKVKAKDTSVQKATEKSHTSGKRKKADQPPAPPIAESSSHRPPASPPAEPSSSTTGSSLSNAKKAADKRKRNQPSSSDHPVAVAIAEETRALAHRGELGRNQHTHMKITTSNDRSQALYVSRQAAPSQRHRGR